MTLIKRNQNLSPFDQLLNNFFSVEDNWPVGFHQNHRTQPAVNIEEDDKEYRLELAVPGMQKDQFKIELDQDVLTISGEAKEENQEEKRNYARREFVLTSFSRRFNLPEGKVKEDKIKANYRDGVLMVSLPKKEEYQPAPARLIEVK